MVWDYWPDRTVSAVSINCNYDYRDVRQSKLEKVKKVGVLINEERHFTMNE